MIHWKELTREGRIEAIRSVWFPGCSTAQIAANFKDVTRNAIIGMYHRFPNSLTDKPLRSHAAADADKKHKNRRARATMRFLPSHAISKPLPQPVEIAFEHRLCGKPLMMLQSGECRFSVNDASGEDLHLFCALPADGAYCHHHKSRAHQPAK